jgi:hypothetical protein
MKIKLSTFFKKEYLILYAIVIIGSFLRLQGVFTNSFAFTYDVGRDMLALSNIIHLHKIPLIGATTGLPGIFYGPWWYYLLTPFFIIFSGNPRGIALTMSLVGITTIILGFYFGKKIGGNLLGLILAALISVSPYLISLSSQIWNPNISPFFVVLILLVIFKIFDKSKIGKSIFYTFLGILLALSIDLEIVYGLLLSIGILLSIILIKRTVNFRAIIFFIIGSLIILAPRIVFELRHQFLMTHSLITFFLSGNSTYQILAVLDNLMARTIFIFNQFSETLANGNQILAILEIIFILIPITVFYKRGSVMLKNFLIVSAIVISTFLIGLTLFNHDIWPHYLVGLPIFYVLLFSISIYLVAKNLSNKAAILMVLVTFVMNLSPYSLIQNLNKPMWVGDAAVYRNQLAVIDYVYKDARGRDFKYVVYTPPVYDYTYQYLFLWYGPAKYHYSPSQQSNLAYFILESDAQNPQRLVDWLKQRQGDGKIIKTEKLKSGIIVETRINQK